MNDRPVIRYDLLREMTPRELAAEVERLIQNGWQPVGAAFVSPNG